VVMGRNTFAPGARNTCACPDERGTVITFVESGTFTFQIASSEGRIVRGANTATPRDEPMPASTPFTASAGDALGFPGKFRIEANDGTEPATYVFALLLAPVAPPETETVGEITGGILGVIPGTWPALGAGSVTVTLQKAVLDPGASLTAPAGGLQFAV